MARPPLKPHIIDVGAVKLGIVLPDQYKGIGALLGIEKDAPGGTPPDGSTSPSEAMRRGQAVRIRISYLGSVGSTSRRKTATLLCAIEKAKTACTQLVGKQFLDTHMILSAYFPRRARYS
jgi:hypothetical protein